MMQSLPEPDISAKVAFLRRPEAFPDAPDSVSVIETHFAWVFLSRRYVYKLKKPVRFQGVDLTTREARRANCELEIALNRRLAAETYIGVVALGRQGARLRLECNENPADWLVKMHRLSPDHTLDHVLPSMDPDDPRLARLLDKLCGFYGRTAPAPWDASEYTKSLKNQIIRYASELAKPELALDHAPVNNIVARQMRFIDDNRALFESRIAHGRVVDAHGDLRPEHVFLTDNPQIIDCLEFSAELRQLDTAEEISFLALECERLGRPAIGERLRGLYMERCKDDIPLRLFDFYGSRRALIRAFLSAWHLREHPHENVAHRWLEQARWYIATARSSIMRASHAVIRADASTDRRPA
jgi:aminoglycoside phosphotransferase family enzyme